MGWTIFIHPQLWCRLFDCLLTRWTLILCTAKVLQPEFANNCGFPPLIQDLFNLLTDLTPYERDKELKAVATMRSDVLLIWLFASNHLRRLVVRLELTDFPMTKHGWVVLFIHAQLPKHVF